MRRPKGLGATAADQLLDAFARVAAALKDMDSGASAARHR
jgi:hypothetical protein